MSGEISCPKCGSSNVECVETPQHDHQCHGCGYTMLPVVTASTGADRWPAEVVEAVAEAIWSEYVYGDSKSKYRQARAALAVVPPDPVIAEIRELFADTNVHSAVLMQRVANVLEGDHPEAFITQIESDRQQVRNLVGDWFDDYNLGDDFLGMLNRSGFQIERKADAIARLLADGAET